MSRHTNSVSAEGAAAPAAKPKKAPAIRKPAAKKIVAEKISTGEIPTEETTPGVLPASEEAAPNTDTFKMLGLEPKLLAAVTKLGFVAPTPIQRNSIPVGIKGETSSASRKPEPAKPSRSACRFCISS